MKLCRRRIFNIPGDESSFVIDGVCVSPDAPGLPEGILGCGGSLPIGLNGLTQSCSPLPSALSHNYLQLYLLMPLAASFRLL